MENQCGDKENNVDGVRILPKEAERKFAARKRGHGIKEEKLRVLWMLFRVVNPPYDLY